MDINYGDAQFDNIQLMKLVNSAEILLQRLHNLVSNEEKGLIDQWLCLKQEYEETCNNSILDSNENLDGSSMLSPIDEVSETEETSNRSSLSRPLTIDFQNQSNTKLDCKNCDYTPEQISIVSESDFCITEQTIAVPESEFCGIQQTSVGSEPDFETSLNEYISEFKTYTDASTALWLSNLSFCLLAAVDTSYNSSELLSSHLANRITSPFAITKKFANKRVYGSDIKNKNNKGLSSFECNNSYIQNDKNLQYKPVYGEHKCRNQNKCGVYLKRDIQHLQEVRLPLIQIRRNIVECLRGDPLETSSKYRDYLKLEIVIEAVDITIEMKNQLYLGHNILEMFEISDQADSTIADCLSMLSLDEVKCLLITFLKKVIDIRESSSKLDKEILKQDNFVSYQKFQIRNLKKMMNNNKTFYENQFISLRKEYEEKLSLMCSHPVAATSSIESDVDNRDQNMLSVFPRHRLQPPVQTELKKIKIGQFSAVLDGNIPNVNLKMLQGNNAPDVKVTRQKNKLIIQQGKSGIR